MDRPETTVYLHPSGARLKLVPVRSSTTQTEKIMKETKKTSVRTIKTVTTARHAGQKVVCVNTKVITTTSTSSGRVILRQLSDTTENRITDGEDLASIQPGCSRDPTLTSDSLHSDVTELDGNGNGASSKQDVPPNHNLDKYPTD